MVQDEFSRPRFSVASAFWVYRGSVSVEQRHCLCGTETMSVWNRHSVCVGHTQCLCVGHTQSRVVGRAVRGQLQPHTGASQSPTHTPKIAIPQLRGENWWLSLIFRRFRFPGFLDVWIFLWDFGVWEASQTHPGHGGIDPSPDLWPVVASGVFSPYSYVFSKDF